MVWRTTMWGYLGEASLGYKPAIPADGKRIDMGYPAYYPMPIGSGVTCEYPYGDTPRPRHAHDGPRNEPLAARHLPSVQRLQTGRQVPVLGDALQRRADVRLCEHLRPRIARMDHAHASSQPASTMTLGDFITTGDAAKFHPPAGEPDEYIYLENHQGISVFDDVTTRTRRSRGVAPASAGAVHRDGQLRILPSDGRWQWNVLTGPSSVFRGAVPVFSRGAPDIMHGLSHRDQIPTPSSLVNWMVAYRNGAGEVNCGSHLRRRRISWCIRYRGTPGVLAMQQPRGAHVGGHCRGSCVRGHRRVGRHRDSRGGSRSADALSGEAASAACHRARPGPVLAWPGVRSGRRASSREGCRLVRTSTPVGAGRRVDPILRRPGVHLDRFQPDLRYHRDDPGQVQGSRARCAREVLGLVGRSTVSMATGMTSIGRRSARSR